jgi:hypothetical protein
VLPTGGVRMGLLLRHHYPNNYRKNVVSKFANIVSTGSFITKVLIVELISFGLKMTVIKAYVTVGI